MRLPDPLQRRHGELREGTGPGLVLLGSGLAPLPPFPSRATAPITAATTSPTMTPVDRPEAVFCVVGWAGWQCPSCPTGGKACAESTHFSEPSGHTFVSRLITPQANQSFSVVSGSGPITSFFSSK